MSIVLFCLTALSTVPASSTTVCLYRVSLFARFRYRSTWSASEASTCECRRQRAAGSSTQRGGVNKRHSDLVGLWSAHLQTQQQLHSPQQTGGETEVPSTGSPAAGSGRRQCGISRPQRQRACHRRVLRCWATGTFRRGGVSHTGRETHSPGHPHQSRHATLQGGGRLREHTPPA
jgi:hypothetical protein